MGIFCWCWMLTHAAWSRHGAVPTCSPRSAPSPGSLWGPPLAPALREPSPNPRKKARPTHKSRLFGCHLLPVISASRRAVPTLSWPFPTYVPITGWAGGEGPPPGAAPSATPPLIYHPALGRFMGRDRQPAIRCKALLGPSA